MRTRVHSIVLAFSSVLALAATAAAQEDAVTVYQEVQGSVVALANAEGSGTGMVIDREGLILTNAHVVASPLPFHCVADVRRGNDYRTVTFEDVEIIGFHPSLDLALVRVDPRAQRGVLQPVTFARRKGVPGQVVFAIGNPSGGGVSLNKTITQGILSGVDRVVEGDNYYQIDAAINPGNSGGPLCDRRGDVLGIVTLKFTDVENVGFAIPLQDLDINDFVPLEERETDPQQAHDLLVEALDWYNRAEEYEDEQGAGSEDALMARYLSAMYYHSALTHDPGNYSIYYNIGMLMRTIDEDEAASAYLTEAVRLAPWGDGDTGNSDFFRELGFSFIKQNRKDEALTAWREGVAKFPLSGVKIWEDLAVFYGVEGRAYEAAYAAGIVVARNDDYTRLDVAREIYRHNTATLSRDEREELESELEDIVAKLEEQQEDALKERDDGVSWLTPEFEEYITEGH